MCCRLARSLGYCTPGMIMAAADLLARREGDGPISEEEVRNMPRVTPAVIAQFTDIAAQYGTTARARAIYDGLPGRPVVLGREYFDQIVALQGDVGAREVLKAIGAYPIECSHLRSPADVDTPAALEELRG